MKIFPAIDLYGGKAVRLLYGDFNKVKVYAENPLLLVDDFQREEAEYLHIVDLDGAKNGKTDNINLITEIVKKSNFFVQVGGGIRNLDTVKKYLDIGVDRVILGTAALNDRTFLEKSLEQFSEKIAVSVDIKEGCVAVKGWLEKSSVSAMDFTSQLEELGVKTIIVTDISKDVAMQGTNLHLYNMLSEKLSLDIIASGGVSSIEDISNLKELEIYGAIIGKAYYEEAISLREAIRVARWLQRELYLV